MVEKPSILFLLLLFGFGFGSRSQPEFLHLGVEICLVKSNPSVSLSKGKATEETYAHDELNKIEERNPKFWREILLGND